MAEVIVNLSADTILRADVTGVVYTKQTGGPAGAVEIYDDNGPVVIRFEGRLGPGSGQVSAPNNSGRELAEATAIAINSATP